MNTENTTPTAQSRPSAENVSMVGRKVEIARGLMKGLKGTVVSCEIVSGYTRFTVKFDNGQTIPEMPGTALYVHPEQPPAGARDAESIGEIRHAMEQARDVCREVFGMAAKVGPIYSKANTAAWGLSAALKHLEALTGKADGECRYCGDTGYFYSEPEFGSCSCPLGKVTQLSEDRQDLKDRLLAALESSAAYQSALVAIGDLAASCADGHALAEALATIEEISNHAIGREATQPAATGAGDFMDDGMCYCQEGVICPACEKEPNTAATGMGEAVTVVANRIRAYAGPQPQARLMSVPAHILHKWSEDLIAALAAQPAPVVQSPSYDALLIIVQAMCGGLERAGLTDCDNPGIAIDGIRLRAERIEASFKNFHRSLCDRFGYTHDQEYWWRDLVSLEEHIAKQPAPVVGGSVDTMVEILRTSLDADIDAGESLHTLVIRASNALHWRGKEIEELRALLAARPGGDAVVFAQVYVSDENVQVCPIPSGRLPSDRIRELLGNGTHNLYAHPAQAGGGRE